MKNYFVILLFFSLLTFLACESKPNGISQATADTSQPSEAGSTTVDKKTSDTTKVMPLPTEHDCTAAGKPMEGNELFLPQEQLWVCIVADDISRDPDFGDSYRILDIYDTKDCKRITRKVLPVNNSPDFPWYIFEHSYNEKHRVVCTAGFEFTYCFDAENRMLLDQMKPEFLLSRRATDAQSGMPLGMGMHKNYLFGCTQDNGFYAFNLSDKKAVKPFLPVAEYHLKSKNLYHSLFLVPATDNTYQAIIPAIEPNTGVLFYNALFKNPIQINPFVAKNVQNNRFQIFRDESSKENLRIAIDLLNKKQVNLPATIASQPVGAILDYLKRTTR